MKLSLVSSKIFQQMKTSGLNSSIAEAVLHLRVLVCNLKFWLAVTLLLVGSTRSRCNFRVESA